jgi:aspartate carbamoyltransferase catalytic subunit
MRHLIDIEDLSLAEIDGILDLTDDIIRHRKEYAEAMRGKKLATLFFEPSTRTRLSFEAAMLELGGNVIGFAEPNSSSAAKGESVADTVRTVACYADIIAMRHPKEGAPMAAVARSKVPIINAGDGGHNHPTQTLTDLATIRRDMGRLDHLVVGLCGDLKFGRTVHSLITAMSRYEGVEFVLISPPELVIPDYLKRTLAQRGAAWREVQALEDVMGDLDVLYMTRVQKERFFNEADYVRLKDSYILTPEKLVGARNDLIICTRCPASTRSPTGGRRPRARYFAQAENGKFVRRALMMTLLAATA